MVLASITHIRDRLDYAKQGWTDLAALAWCMEKPTLHVPCCLLQEIKATILDTALTKSSMREVSTLPSIPHCLRAHYGALATADCDIPS